MRDDIQGKLERTMAAPVEQGARLPRWVGAALVSAGLVLPTVGCWDSVGPSAVYAGPPVREPETRPQPPPDEPEGKKGEASTPEEPTMRVEAVPVYGIPR